MLDVEIESLLTESGYQFNPETGLYIPPAMEDAEAEVAEMGSEDVADILEIPLDDLQRWEAAQLPTDEMADDAEPG